MRSNPAHPMPSLSSQGRETGVTNLTTPSFNLRVWQDDRMGKIWRLAYNDGDGETVVSFPDTAAMGDFIAEQLGLNLLDALHEPPMG